jgi:predicted ester cyclase
MGAFRAEEKNRMTKISLLAAALAIVALPACKKKDADAPKTETPPANPTPGSGSAPAPNAKPTDKPAEAAKPKTPQELADMYKACGEKLNSKKVDDFLKDCVDDSYSGTMDGQTMNKDALKGMFTAMQAAFPDMKWAPQIVLVNGHNIFSVALVTGTHEGTMKEPGMPDVPATHKKFGMLWSHELKVGDDGKAKTELPFADDGTMMSQLGLMPKDAEPKRAAMDKGIDGAPILVVAADDAKEKANVELVKKTDDAFNSHKPADLLALMTDDAVESDQAAPKDSKGKKEIEKGIKDFQTAFSDGKVTATETWGAGDYVVELGKFEGTNDHDMGKMKKTGKHVSVNFAEVTQIKDGKVAHLWRFYNGMDFAKQLGLMPAAPAGAPAGGDAAKPGDKKDDKKPADKKDDKKPAAPPAKK